MDFKKVQGAVEVTLRCQRCNKKRKRRLTEYQTANPWNKDVFGLPKTYMQIIKENHVKLEQAKADLLERGIICGPCSKEQGDE